MRDKWNTLIFYALFVGCSKLYGCEIDRTGILCDDTIRFGLVRIFKTVDDLISLVY